MLYLLTNPFTFGCTNRVIKTPSDRRRRMGGKQVKKLNGPRVLITLIDEYLTMFTSLRLRSKRTGSSIALFVYGLSSDTCSWAASHWAFFFSSKNAPVRLGVTQFKVRPLCEGFFHSVSSNPRGFPDWIVDFSVQSRLMGNIFPSPLLL